MQEINDKYSDKGVKVLGILKDNKIESAKKILDQKGGKYTNILATDSLADGFLDKIMYTPTTLIVDNNSEILGELIVGTRSTDEFSKLIEEALIEAEKQAEIRNKVIPGGELSIEGFVKALETNGFRVSEVGKILSGMLGAEEGYKYTVNSRDIEIYRFDLNSKDPLTVENIKSAKESGTVRIPLKEGEHIMPVIMKGNIAVYGIDKHKDKEKILKIFDSLE